MGSFTKRLQSAFAIDLRTLALFRVFAAIAVIANVVGLVPEFSTWLTDSGLQTRQDAMAVLSPHHFSLYFVSGAGWFSAALLCLTVAAASAMLFGWKTRWATVITWLLTLSLANRVPGLISGADMQLTVLLFWAMFLPLGARFSVDSALAEQQPADNRYFSVATAALLLQVAYLYFFGALLKTGSYWRETYDAVYFAVTSAHIATPLATYLAEYPGFLRALTAYVWWLELLAVVFLFTPFMLTAARSFILPQLVLLHIGFALFLAIAIFPLVSITGLLAFTPGAAWDRFLGWWNTRRARRGIAMYYDRDCGFCLKTCQIFRELALPPASPIVVAQTDPAIGALLERENSWVVRTHDGALLTKWEAVAYVWRRSPLLWPIGVISMAPGLRSLGQKVYHLIASARPRLAKQTERWLPRPTSAVFQPSRATSIVVGFMAALVLAWNVGTLRSGPVDLYFPDELRPLLFATRLAQTWNMFAPQPMHESDWLVVEGVSEGRADDVLFRTPRPVRHEKPVHGFQAFPGFRWRKYYERTDITAASTRLGEYYCARAGRAGLSVDKVVVTRYRERTAAPGHPAAEPEIRARIEHPCR